MQIEVYELNELLDRARDAGYALGHEVGKAKAQVGPAPVGRVAVKFTRRPERVISAIKEVRADTGMGLKEAKDAVELGHVVLLSATAIGLITRDAPGVLVLA